MLFHRRGLAVAWLGCSLQIGSCTSTDSSSLTIGGESFSLSTDAMFLRVIIPLYGIIMFSFNIYLLFNAISKCQPYLRRIIFFSFQLNTAVTKCDVGDGQNRIEPEKTQWIQLNSKFQLCNQ